VLSLWTVLAARADFFFWTTYLPGWALGLGLCWMHGRFEHPGGTTVSHYGAVYNLLFFNDGYHVEHHRSPGAHWTELPLQPVDSPGGSRWPAVLRWLEGAHCPVINRLERLSLRSARLQSFLLRTHGAALSRLFPLLAGARSIRIVGGGLFPRSAILLRRLLPDAAITIMDASAHNIAAARPFVPGGVEFEARKYDGAPDGADLVVIPLSFRGNRRALYENPPARALLIHDWIWEARGEGAVVSWLLLKRVNLVQRIRP
ncbi:MAG TPA: fatty acid desaturase, partial [Terriglobia bacterium]|nr:fatty acid desaturase [Terriglobia bacterium]